MSEPIDFVDVAQSFFKDLYENYLSRIRAEVEKDPRLLETVAGFLIHPQKVILYFTRHHIVIEYEGPDRVGVLPVEEGLIELQAFDYADEEDPFSEIVGFNYDDETSGISMPLIDGMVFDDLIMPTNRAFDKLLELGWNTGAQDHILSLNGGGLEIKEGHSARIVNGLFFDASQAGLVTRHIKWLDCIPIKRIDAGDVWEMGYRSDLFAGQALYDARYNYYVPSDYRLKKLPYINRFIEFYSAPGRSEVDITTFLSKNDFRFILTMRFGCVDIISQPTLDWQSETRPSIKPDFLLVQTDGYIDICEFKLPRFKSNAVVGLENREAFSSEVHSYVAQTRVYQEYFDDPNNRAWLEEKYQVKAYRPKRYLVAGERSHLRSDDWRKIASDFRDISIINYNDLVDGVVAQFYK